MDAVQFFLDAYSVVRRQIGRLDRYPPDVWRARPQNLNSIAWLVWHLARFEDVAVNRLFDDKTQVLDDPVACWPQRMRVPLRDVGVGMTDGEVGDLTAAIDIDALRAYSATVGERTRLVAGTLPPAAWGEIVNRERLQLVFFAEGALRPEASWVERWVQDWTRGRFLSYFALLHNTGHMYDKSIVLGLIGHPGR